MTQENPGIRKFGQCFLCGKQKKRTKYQTCFKCRANMRSRSRKEGQP